MQTILILMITGNCVDDILIDRYTQKPINSGLTIEYYLFCFNEISAFRRQNQFEES